MGAEKKPEILAVIPARGGSKGLPGKNILPLAGHPLIAWSVLAAKQCPAITRVICSTDDEEIARVARFYGAEIPFMRPAALAQDLSTDLEVFEYTLHRLEEEEGYTPELVIQLRPTSPVRVKADLEICIAKMLADKSADSLRIITEAPATPYKMWTLPNGEENAMQPLLKLDGVEEPFNQPRQSLPKVYWQVGTLDIIRPRAIKGGTMSGKKVLPFVISRQQSVDIDDAAGFAQAEEAIHTFGAISFPAGAAVCPPKPL